jgi:hypothetical protein
MLVHSAPKIRGLLSDQLGCRPEASPSSGLRSTHPHHLITARLNRRAQNLRVQNLVEQPAPLLPDGVEAPTAALAGPATTGELR